MSNKPHVHAELIKAWADGAEIQFQTLNGEWIDVIDGESPSWFPSSCYRIKPQPKPDIKQVWFVSPVMMMYNPLTLSPNLIVTFDGETGALKSAEVIK